MGGGGGGGGGGKITHWALRSVTAVMKWHLARYFVYRCCGHLVRCMPSVTGCVYDYVTDFIIHIQIVVAAPSHAILLTPATLHNFYSACNSASRFGLAVRR